MNLIQIVEKYLIDNGFDGLYHDSDCACEIGDLAPCCYDNIKGCLPGYKTACDCGEDGDEHEWHISDRKDAAPEQPTDAIEYLEFSLVDVLCDHGKLKVNCLICAPAIGV